MFGESRPPLLPSYKAIDNGKITQGQIPEEESRKAYHVCVSFIWRVIYTLF